MQAFYAYASYISSFRNLFDVTVATYGKLNSHELWQIYKCRYGCSGCQKLENLAFRFKKLARNLKW